MWDKNTLVGVGFANQRLEYAIILKLMTGYRIKNRKLHVMTVMDQDGGIELKIMAVCGIEKVHVKPSLVMSLS